MWKVNLEDFGNAIIEIIGKEVYKKETAIEKLLEKYADKIRDEIKAGSPRGKTKRRSYKSGWTVKKELVNAKYVLVVYNKNKPKLTHLLEKGTAERYTNKTNAHKGKIEEGGKTVHIRPAVDKLIPEFKEKLKEI